MSHNPQVTVLTAAMCQGNKLERIRDAFPKRFFDTGICESHAVAFAAGQAKAGLRPDDLIVNVDGDQVVSIKAYKEILDKVRPGSSIKLEVRRGDRLTGVDLKVEPPKTLPTPKKS